MIRHIDHLISDPVTIENCLRCGQPTLRAMTSGLDTRCDPHPLNLPSELDAAIAGRATYNVAPWAGRYYLLRRDLWRIQASYRDQAVVADHHCEPDGLHHDSDPRLLVPPRLGDIVVTDTPPF